ncbi:hypothetical protein TCAL_13249 [Tigriopus californicus]|uniref:EF-hand domain-containing protein n=1 Tax=Tigriopus californicus TaxID=6832 RepID=A0A553PSG3_TIGCA|nr:uncharacterized protein LOC131891358 [Tigriopus californicus]XP_059096870.1 uncharacterized protein LOC131891358 [Tigriopus californicus]XP_059096871.1 uncharacterized protein LOC131891358 [Tigriopus californicus]TRY80615.1 hypothetical protein TCAL_13249 [Tigriopus californicus]|eukprot:TCALIF_13249-PA protein Name:"Similar to Calmodulin (Spinacia oleracea)" AED:0.05 eAED:0.05 QI:225/1/1/1/0.5/0.33/3/34/161
MSRPTTGASRPTTAKEMTESQIGQYRQAFKMFDKNHDERISSQELGMVMRELGFDPTEDELKDMIGNADADGSGSIEFPEFLNLMIKRFASDDKMEEMKAAFEVFDKNKDNKISRSELKSAMRKMGESTSDHEIDAIIHEADLDKDGMVDYYEFITVFQQK